MGKGSLREFVKVMKALSDPSRVKILKMLQRRKMCVCEIQAALGLAQPTISKHMRILDEAELVRFEKDGLWVNYSLSGKPANPFVPPLLEQLEHWLEEEPEVKALTGRLSEFDREKICEKGVERQRKKAAS